MTNDQPRVIIVGHRHRIVNLTRGTVLAERAELANTFARRLRGLIGRKPLPPGTGLVLQPSNAVHSFLMGFDIDVVHLDRDGRVLRVTRALPRGRVSAARGGYSAVELPAGTVAGTGTEVGDIIAFEQTADQDY